MMQKYCILTVSLIGLLSLAIAYFFMQLYLGLSPCPLCIIDRYAVGSMSIVGLASWFFYPKLKTTAAVLMLLAVVGGLGTGIRHVYIEWFPLESSSCSFASEDNSLADFFINAFAGRSDCSQVDWTLAGFSLAEMTLALFAFLFIFLIYLLFFSKGRSN